MAHSLESRLGTAIRHSEKKSRGPETHAAGREKGRQRSAAANRLVIPNSVSPPSVGSVALRLHAAGRLNLARTPCEPVESIAWSGLARNRGVRGHSTACNPQDSGGEIPERKSTLCRMPRCGHSPQQGHSSGTKTVRVAEYFVLSYPSPDSFGSSRWATTR